MKTMIKFVLILITSIVLFTGCDKVETTTEIHKDGSCTRSIRTDSSDIGDTPYPLPVSEGWDVRFAKNESDNAIYYASRQFDSVDELARDIQLAAGDEQKLLITPRLEKRFRWFYTYFRYSEVYGNIKSRFMIPMEDYFTAEEIELLANTSDSVKADEKLDDKFEEWITRNFFESFYLSMKQAVDNLGNPDLSAELLQSKKEELYRVFYEDELISLDENDEKFTENDMIVLSESLGTDAVYQLRGALDNIFAGLMKELEWLAALQLTDFKQIVIMPGLIIDTNAKSVEGNKVVWDMDNDVLFVKDYEMWVESRIVNLGFIIGTMIFVVILGVILVLSAMRKRII